MGGKIRLRKEPLDNKPIVDMSKGKKKSVKSRYRGMYVVAKFFLSRAPNGRYNCVSRTLGKISVICNEDEDKVDDQDVWLCKILCELHPGQDHGAFILKPLRKVDMEKRIRKLIPGFYGMIKDKGAIILMPNTDPADYWIISAGTRDIFRKRYHTIIVPITYSEELAEQNRLYELAEKELEEAELKAKENQFGASAS